ncbi:MarR family winged helix-turn-helix transcriptional regulator [Microbacterium sp. P07]|uniref:MarR family winged helix-turn-helix transcriptional regulator n=1 Tax=Microbacterium sp. P07 TaxID=3366952 RepID=UPI003745216A
MPKGTTSTRVPLGDSDLITEPLSQTIDPENFTPRLMALLSNALVWRESHQLRRRFGLGTNDWRVISVLGIKPGASATEVTEFIGVNKAVVSKSVTALSERDLIALVDGPRGSRPLYLTAAGAEMHAAMMPISVSGQDVILDGMPAEDVAALNTLLRDMIEKVREADADEADELETAGARA